MREIAIQTDALPLLPAMPPPRHRYLRLLALLAAAVATFIVVYFTYVCPAGTCGSLPADRTLPLAPLMLTDRQGRPLPSAAASLSFEEMLTDDFRFDLEDRDVIVFLHIQKTGGTEFGRHLVHDLQLKRPCVCHRRQKRCQCFRPGSNSHWLFSRYSTGWKCGLHADWTELTSCVDEAMDHMERDEKKRRYFYIALLREPVQRYLSEWKHVRRGATWSTSRHWCGGREATENEIPSCYVGDGWDGVTLDEFLACDSNMANNRQTRMLADLHLVNCYSQAGMSSAERDRVLLASAKTNIRQMAFFGLTEEQQRSQYMFEEVFNLRFVTAFAAYNKTHADSALRSLRPDQLAAVRRRNRLDLELYEYARSLLAQRFERLRATDSSFEAHYSSLGKLGDDYSREVDRRR
ncbi:heparan-sulfate 6-O-sulfotransferase 3-B-like [Pollicipes pollicipes]|uniref:heparan-sulfate 6-O-sulfotransferase 3-B-like n=1 Tax=Pollicipes pollicipes TaxID=41117 RepID=UPI001884B841|nr:heparan-sulfate 6-O-sulfotransferase 3-B-like [Pollicipes pollicipes]XP_037075756.1 heparan-sulfate 6-O-sulfotransferase 3-B-like [Pollicipes pollicipes]